MYVEVEPTGCTERKGLLQVRFCMYLEPGDYGYSKHYVQVYARTLTQDELDDHALRALVPMVWQNNPFHNHFVYVVPSMSDKEIMDIGEKYLHEAFAKWSVDEFPKLLNPKVVAIPLDSAKVNAKLKQIKKIKLERRL